MVTVPPDWLSGWHAWLCEARLKYVGAGQGDDGVDARDVEHTLDAGSCAEPVAVASTRLPAETVSDPRSSR